MTRLMKNRPEQEVGPMDSMGSGGMGYAQGARLITFPLLIFLWIGVFFQGDSYPEFCAQRAEDHFFEVKRPGAADRFHMSFPWCELHVPRV
jgi:hypothetical protein